MWWPWNKTYPERRAEEVDGREYDYIIIGGRNHHSIFSMLTKSVTQAEGFVLASRLLENPNISVPALERGSANDTWFSRIPC
jgi:hypothetical protein